MPPALRLFRPLLVAFPLAAFACKAERPPPGSQGPGPAAAVAGPASEPGTQSPAAAVGSAADEAARAFLRAVGEGKVDYSRVTPAFLKAVAEPELPSDVARGYDAAAARDWFARADFLRGASPPAALAATGEAAVYLGSWGAARQHGRYALRLVSTADGWKADWLQLLSGHPAEVAPAPGPEGAFAAFAAICTADALTKVGPGKDGDLAFAAALLTPALRARLGPPFASDRPRGYNAGQLRSRLAELADGATGYALTPAAGGAPAYRAELTGGGKPRALRIAAARGAAPGEWLADDIAAE